MTGGTALLGAHILLPDALRAPLCDVKGAVTKLEHIPEVTNVETVQLLWAMSNCSSCAAGQSSQRVAEACNSSAENAQLSITCLPMASGIIEGFAGP